MTARARSRDTGNCRWSFHGPSQPDASPPGRKATTRASRSRRPSFPFSDFRIGIQQSRGRLMPIIGKSMVLGAALLAGSVATGNANPVCRADTGSCDPSGQYFPVLPTPAAPSTSSSIRLPEVTVYAPYAPYSCHGLGPRVSSCGTIRNEHYEVPLSFDANVVMHPYSSGIGPWPGPGTKRTIDKPPSHHERWPWISEHGIARGASGNRALP